MHARLAPRAAALLLLLLLPLLPALVALAPTAAAAGGEETLGPGELYLRDALVVGPETTLQLRPGTILRGPGHVEVHGALHVQGTHEAPVVLRVPLLFVGNGTSHLRNVTLEAVGGAAVTVRNGTLTVENATFRDNRVGLVVSDPAAALHVRDSTFDGHTAAALRVDGGALTRLTNVTVRQNAVGLLARLEGGTPLALELARCRFEDNVDHVRLDFGATPNPGAAVRVVGGTFRAGAFRVASDLASPPAATTEAPVVHLEDNHVAGSDVGLTARGAGFLVRSTNDTFADNRVAISAAGSALALSGTRFSSLERDLDLDEAARLSLDGAALTTVASGDAPAPPGSSPPWAYALGGALAVAGVAAAWRRRRARSRTGGATAVALDDDEGAPSRGRGASDGSTGRAGGAGAADLQGGEAAPAPREWSELEARILHDIHRHPGTPQTEVARRLGLSRQALHYHVKKLVDAGAVLKTPQGRTTECRVAPGLRLPPLPPMVTQQDALEKG